MDRAAPDTDASRLTIRAQEPADAPGVSALFGSLGVVENTLQLPDMPVASRVDHMEKIEPGACKIVAEHEGRIVAAAALHMVGTSLRRSHVRMLAIGIAPEWQGKGVGRLLLARLCDWADNWAHVLRIELLVHADNERAIALYKSMGFVEEGRLKAYALKNGRLIDSLYMGRLHPSPPQLPD